MRSRQHRTAPTAPWSAALARNAFGPGLQVSTRCDEVLAALTPAGGRQRHR